MQDQATTTDDAKLDAVLPVDGARRRRASRELTLRSALRKRAVGVPTYSVPEAAALLSVSQEHLYRLIRGDAFPALPMRSGNARGRYVVPARAVEQLLNAASEAADTPRDRVEAGSAS